MRPPVQAPPHRGFCPGGRALWLGEIAELSTQLKLILFNLIPLPTA